MSATPAVAPPAPELCHGTAIEYKALTRPFLNKEKSDAVLYLIATCSYGTPGFTIFFEDEGSGNFRLMEQPPTGVVMELVSYYIATWPTKSIPAETQVPTHVTIVDAYGEHRVHVRPWT
jgi:hypothetical protein